MVSKVIQTVSRSKAPNELRHELRLELQDTLLKFDIDTPKITIFEAGDTFSNHHFFLFGIYINQISGGVVLAQPAVVSSFKITS